MNMFLILSIDSGCVRRLVDYSHVFLALMNGLMLNYVDRMDFVIRNCFQMLLNFFFLLSFPPELPQIY